MPAKAVRKTGHPNTASCTGIVDTGYTGAQIGGAPPPCALYARLPQPGTATCTALPGAPWPRPAMSGLGLGSPAPRRHQGHCQQGSPTKTCAVTWRSSSSARGSPKQLLSSHLQAAAGARRRRRAAASNGASVHQQQRTPTRKQQRPLHPPIHAQFTSTIATHLAEDLPAGRDAR